MTSSPANVAMHEDDLDERNKTFEEAQEASMGVFMNENAKDETEEQNNNDNNNNEENDETLNNLPNFNVEKKCGATKSN